jgi:parvulin-like peptidyl-prolyl isomerase
MRRLSLIVLVPLALAAAACGGGGSKSGRGSVPRDAVAVVDGHRITRTELDRRMHQADCSYKLQKRTFPKAGSPEFQQIQSQILQNLVQRTELEQQAPKLGVSVSDSKLQDQLKQIKKQYFQGSEKRYQAELKRQCITDAEVRVDLTANLLSDAIYKKVTASVKVSDADVKSYYDTHRQVYTQPETRVVRHILVKDKKRADTLYAQLKAGADFAALAKKYSQDPGSKSQGGQLTIQKGQTVPAFDKEAFALKTGELSKPVHTQFGWHIIQAVKATTPRKSTPFKQVKETIRQQLEQQQKSAALQKWLDGIKADYANKVSYASGLAPATTSTSTTPTTTG